MFGFRPKRRSRARFSSRVRDIQVFASSALKSSRRKLYRPSIAAMLTRGVTAKFWELAMPV
jgi:hypothetical protein